MSVAFGDLFLMIRNGMTSGQNKSRRGYPVSRIETISSGEIDGERVGFAELDAATAAKWLLREGDILFSHINSPPRVGGCALYRGVPDRLLHGMNLLCLRPHPTRLDPAYGVFLIRSAGFISKMAPFVNRAVNQASISIGNLKAIRVHVPDLAEQRRIAELLDRAEALRAKRRAALDQLETLKQSIFMDMFGEAINAGAYEVRPLGEFIDEERPIAYGILKPGPHVDAGVPYVQVVDIQRRGVNVAGVKRTTPELDEEYRRSRLHSGDVVMSIRGHVGRFGVVPPVLEGANVSRDVARLAIKKIEPAFLVEQLLTPRLQNWMRQHTKGVAVQGINLRDLRLVPVAAPQRSEQEKFVRRMQDVEKALEDGERSRALVYELFTSVNQKAFSREM